MSSRETKYAALAQFFAANGVYATLLVGILAIGPDVRATFANHPLLVIGVILLLEAITIAMLWLLNGNPRKVIDDDPFPNEAIDRILLRFATVSDFASTEAVYREWFSSTVSIDDAEYNLLLARGGYVRVAEAILTSGAKRIIGFYSVWPITRDTFDLMVSGRLKEKQMTANLVLPIGSEDASVIYISEICVSKGSQVGATLLRDAIGYTAKLFNDHPSVSTLAAWGYTEVGKTLAKRFCMRRCTRSDGRATEFYEVPRQVVLQIPRPRNVFKAERQIKL